MPKARASFMVFGKLPGMNDLILASKRHWSSYNKLKKDGEALVREAIKGSLGERDVFNNVAIHYRFYEQKENRDRDNIIAAGMKIINDALVKEGVIEDDSQGHLVSIQACVQLWTEEAIDVIIEGERADGTRADRRRKILQRAAAQKRSRAKKKVDVEHRRLHAATAGAAAKPRGKRSGNRDAARKSRGARRQ